MNTKVPVNSAFLLAPAERFALIDEFLHSLDCPDAQVDELWIEEAERCLQAYRLGQVQGIAAQDVLGDF